MAEHHAAQERPRSWPQDLLVGAAAGLLATAVTGIVNRQLERLVRDEDRRREREVREGSPHERAGPMAAERWCGRTLTPEETRRAQRLFSLAYGIGWGMIHAAVRRRHPRTAQMLGLPFALPFFAACDGTIAPLLGLSPTPAKLPARINAKEIANHVVWTGAAEVVHRLAARRT